MRTRPLLAASLLAATVAVAGPSLADTTDPAAAAPDRVVLNPTTDPTTSVMVTWRTSADVDDHRAQVRRPGSRQVVAEYDAWHTERALGQPGAVHPSARMSGLEPGTRYEYRVGGEAGWSGWTTMRTAEEGDAPFTFLYFGDAQNGLADHWPPVVAAARAAEPDARLALHEGDQVDQASADHEWGDWFRGLGGLSATTLTLTSPGNHEYSGDQLITAYRAHHEYPLNGPVLLRHEDVYFVDHQGVRFISLNANEQLGAPDQAVWLRRVALTENPMPWTVVFFHHPVFSASEGRDNPRLRAFWLPTLERLGVDLVLQGHDHTYARGHLVENETGPDAHSGPTYVVSVAGSKYYELAPDDDNVWTRNGARRVVAHEQTSTYQAVRVTPRRLVYRSVIGAKGAASSTRRPVGDLLDAFTVTRRPDGSKVTRDGLPSRLRAARARVRAGAGTVVVRLSAPRYRPGGRLEVWAGSRQVGAARVDGRRTTVRVEDVARGTRRLEVRYSGDGRARPATTAVPVGWASGSSRVSPATAASTSAVPSSPHGPTRSPRTTAATAAAVTGSRSVARVAAEPEVVRRPAYSRP